MKTSGVYQITNTVNGKRYIGSSVNVHRRLLDHRRKLSRGAHHSAALQAAWNKYGAESFVFSLLEGDVPREMLTIREQSYLDQIIENGRAEYNVCTLAGCPSLRRSMVFTPEHRARISQSRQGISFSAEHRANLSKAHLGYRPTDEARANQSAAQTGTTKSVEARANMSRAQKERFARTPRPSGTSLTASTRAKIGARLRGKPKSEEHKAALRAAKRTKKAAPKPKA